MFFKPVFLNTDVPSLFSPIAVWVKVAQVIQMETIHFYLMPRPAKNLVVNSLGLKKACAVNAYDTVGQPKGIYEKMFLNTRKSSS